MASIVKENGKLRAYIYVTGTRNSETFPTKKKAQSWAIEKEAELRKQFRQKSTRGAVVDDSFTLGKLKQKKQFAALAWLFAIETCMRCSEITGLTLATINFKKSIAHLPDTKNGSARNVPLSPKALALLDQLPTPANEKTPIFQVASASVDALFRKYKGKTDIQDLVFHDSRHEGITRLVDTGKHNVFEVAAITGHKNINELLTYYNKSAVQIAKEMAESAKREDSNPLVDIAGIGGLNQMVGLKDLIKEILVEQAKIAA